MLNGLLQEAEAAAVGPSAAFNAAFCCRGAKPSNSPRDALHSSPCRPRCHRVYFVCLFVCVCSSVEGFGLEAEARMTTWHVMMSSENENESTHSHDVSEGETPQPEKWRVEV